AFQNALNILSGRQLPADGALLPHDGNAGDPGPTELATRSLAKQLNLSDAAIHSALAEARTKGFESTSLYQRVFSLADARRGRMLPRAALPQIKLGGPKIKRDLSTAWYA